MENNYQFYRIMGRVTDGSAQPLEDMAVRLRRSGENHETEILSSERTNAKGEYYFELSLRIGARFRLEVYDQYNERVDYMDFVVHQMEEVTINFVV